MDRLQCDPLLLSKTLDNLGVSPEMVEFRISTMKDVQLVYDFFAPVRRGVLLYTGSRAEGTYCTTMVTHLDTMAPDQYVITDINNATSWTPRYQDEYVLIMHDEFTPNGYVQLQAVF
eukprot:GHVU01037725.1.p2 GENE.GHVU01037725.1~~GHVU01037725.1.p2  ORF type:complete len:117 (-),score=9.44 GHVU01037725.1:595-945(-)